MQILFQIKENAFRILKRFFWLSDYFLIWPGLVFLGRFPFAKSVRSDQKWNARVLRTGSGQNDPAHGSEPLRAILFFTPTSRLRTVTAHLTPLKLYHKGYSWLFMVIFGY